MDPRLRVDSSEEDFKEGKGGIQTVLGDVGP
jgi:hypothetical protein